MINLVQDAMLDGLQHVINFLFRCDFRPTAYELNDVLEKSMDNLKDDNWRMVAWRPALPWVAGCRVEIYDRVSRLRPAGQNSLWSNGESHST